MKFRAILSYSDYGVTENGVVKSLKRGIILKQYMLNGYLIVDVFGESLTETLPVHRAVALAWVENPNPELFDIVNHKDGDKLNNASGNLEWTNYSGNNYHAVNSGLRMDNVPCKIRDFYTGDIHFFSSIAQAAELMGFSKDTSIDRLQPKMFGKLLADKYEFKFASDETPWFYESRKELVKPSRFMVTVEDSAGNVREIYSTKALLKEYQLYGSKERSIVALAEYGNKIYPDKRFTVRDSYTEAKRRVIRNTSLSERVPVFAIREDRVEEFYSMTQCARFFNVDRSSISNRLNNGKELNGWTFTTSLSSQ